MLEYRISGQRKFYSVFKKSCYVYLLRKLKDNCRNDRWDFQSNAERVHVVVMCSLAFIAKLNDDIETIYFISSVLNLEWYSLIEFIM